MHLNLKYSGIQVGIFSAESQGKIGAGKRPKEKLIGNMEFSKTEMVMSWLVSP